MNLPWQKNKKSQKRRKPHIDSNQNEYIFRRSRTITGTKADSVDASAAGRGQFKTDRTKLIELKQRRKKTLRFLFGCLICTGLTFFVIINIVPANSRIIGAASKELAQEYSQSINKYLNSHVTERLAFFLQQDNLAKAVIKDNPDIKSLSFSHAWYGGSPEFNVSYRIPVVAWKTGEKKFYVDASGVAFTHNNFNEPSVEVVDQSGLSPDQNNGVVASAKFVKFLGQIVSAINGYDKGRVISVIVPAASRELDIKLQGREYVIKTNTDRDPLQQAEDVNSALSYLDQHKIVPQYVDARVVHKAYYK